MAENKPVMKMPELMVFFSALATGFLGAEIWRIANYLGTNTANVLTGISFVLQVAIIAFCALLCLVYTVKRNGHFAAAKICRSLRFDLLIAVGVGVWTNVLAARYLEKLHKPFTRADPYWGAALLVLLCAVLLSPLLQLSRQGRKRSDSQLYFIADEEINNEEEDLLANTGQAKSFAETVLASGAHAGLVFGVDGPWGTGKTSFINLAERHWRNAEAQVIVCRFEPLRYASEPDLADRLIRDLSAAIQRQVFAPEFRPAASRYSRLIKGKADVSFLGFKLSLEPSQETVDELLEDIDEVLKRIDRRVIIVIDDLDRLDAKTTNSVLFATRRTFKLSQATYVLCYDTEVLTGGKEEGARAREFLEKFVTVKLSLFVDSSSIRDFLRTDWHRAESQLGLIPSDTMVKLGSVLSELATILDGDMAAKYLPFVGDLRKVKRFVNAMLLIQLDKSDLGRTDFDKRDLINLLILHLIFPGLFRRIYAEETEGRSGMFSVRRPYGEPAFKNSEEFSKFLVDKGDGEQFLLRQLFDVDVLQLGARKEIEESVISSRACFNHDSFRNLEEYLKLIVRFATPEPQNTFILYQDAVQRVAKGESISSVLEAPEFRKGRWQHAHDQFWRVLVNQAHDFTQPVAKNAIETLLEYLPYYSAIEEEDRGLRQRSVYSLLRLLDRAGWGRTMARRQPNTPEHVVEIAWRIFGENSYKGNGLIERLASEDRGVLGWNDLMLFRLQCSADRQGQLYNLQSALILDQEKNAPTTGLVSKLALLGMRKLSQEVFALFKRTYIDPGRNFYAEVNQTSEEAFLGTKSSRSRESPHESAQFEIDASTVATRVAAARSFVKSFVIYQLSNPNPPQGSGVGCGHYDAYGAKDGAGIAGLMNEYVFGVCFNPDLLEENVYHFLDQCLANLSNSFLAGRDEGGYIATKAELPGGLDPKEMGRYWGRNRELIRSKNLHTEVRFVVTSNYIASYGEDLAGVFDVLDVLADESVPAKEDLGHQDELSDSGLS